MTSKVTYHHGDLRTALVQSALALLEEEKDDKLERMEKQLLALGEKVEAILQKLK